MKYDVKNSKDLETAMKNLEQKINMQEVKIKDHYEQVKENLQPKNLIKNTYSHIGASPEIQKTLLNTIIGLAIGYGFKKAKDLMNEQTLDRLGKNLIDSILTKIEDSNPQGLVSKSVKMFRQSTPVDSQLHQFVGYRNK